MAAEKKTWFVQQNGWILDRDRVAGEEVEATDEEVKYLLMAGSLGPKRPEGVAEALEG